MLLLLLRRALFTCMQAKPRHHTKTSAESTPMFTT
jgi:hypothetical protein